MLFLSGRNIWNILRYLWHLSSNQATHKIPISILTFANKVIRCQLAQDICFFRIRLKGLTLMRLIFLFFMKGMFFQRLNWQYFFFLANKRMPLLAFSLADYRCQTICCVQVSVVLPFSLSRSLPRSRSRSLSFALTVIPSENCDELSRIITMSNAYQIFQTDWNVK